MQCPLTKFDCISCDERCLLEERRKQNDPFRYGNQLRTCDAELERYGLKAANSQSSIEEERSDDTGTAEQPEVA
jgi:hypothetical protein